MYVEDWTPMLTYSLCMCFRVFHVLAWNKTSIRTNSWRGMHYIMFNYHHPLLSKWVLDQKFSLAFYSIVALHWLDLCIFATQHDHSLISNHMVNSNFSAECDTLMALVYIPIHTYIKFQMEMYFLYVVEHLLKDWNKFTTSCSLKPIPIQCIVTQQVLFVADDFHLNISRPI
jgi:hypothetical protein